MTGRCRYCHATVTLMAGIWKHDGIGALVHIIREIRETRILAPATHNEGIKP